MCGQDDRSALFHYDCFNSFKSLFFGNNSALAIDMWKLRDAEGQAPNSNHVWSDSSGSRNISSYEVMTKHLSRMHSKGGIGSWKESLINVDFLILPRPQFWYFIYIYISYRLYNKHIKIEENWNGCALTVSEDWSLAENPRLKTGQQAHWNLVECSKNKLQKRI